jgi:type IV secretory pathway protease TraF
MMGDNRSISCDSRVWGLVPRSDIVGRVFLVIWRNGRPDFHSI